ncbi:hypothetical protein [Enterococcus faecalis]|uniref:hypothetical protein n=1 Tax=Enterococcus faecalis TaxID=1351 RepID=UPI001F56312F|nr:hypothetical protein [Enterococcus faecalis]HBI2077582.1 hypothetical protein [Enterococcus faecalis]
MGERKTFSGEKFRLNRWGDAIYLREARKGEICTEIREFIPDKKSIRSSKCRIYVDKSWFATRTDKKRIK